MSEENRVGLGKVVMSVLAAMFGVQGSGAHERDFTKGRPAAYIIVGLIFTLLFILTIAGVVTLVMHLSGS
jgi:hypothetical protein